MADRWSTETRDLVRRATADPGAFVPRGPAEDDPNQSHGEPLHRWQTRAVLNALDAAGLLVKPHHTPLPDEGSAEWHAALRELAIRVNGFVYQGDRLNAVVDTVKALRAAPGLAAKLLGVQWIADLAAERARQDAKWGEQNHPDGTGRPGSRHLADWARAVCQANGPGQDNWHDILQEEYYEAMAETDWPKLRKELVEVAAVAAQWIEAGDRRKVPE